MAEFELGVLSWESPVAVEGDMLYAYVQASAPERRRVAPHGRVVALDIARARVSWQTAELGVLDGGDNHYGLTLTRRDVAFCSPDGLLRGLDRTSGALKWQHGLGACEPLVAAEAKSGTETWLYFQGKYFNPRFTKVFATAPVQTETALVTGTVTDDDGKPVASVRVAALGVESITDVDGRYELRVRGSGKLIVQAMIEMNDGDRKCDPSAHRAAEPIALSGAGKYVVDIALRRACSNHED